MTWVIKIENCFILTKFDPYKHYESKYNNVEYNWTSIFGLDNSRILIQSLFQQNFWITTEKRIQQRTFQLYLASSCNSITLLNSLILSCYLGLGSVIWFFISSLYVPTHLLKSLGLNVANVSLGAALNRLPFPIS